MAPERNGTEYTKNFTVANAAGNGRDLKIKQRNMGITFESTQSRQGVRLNFSRTII
jgi:hypothetical protein